jgi:hypothetical protein
MHKFFTRGYLFVLLRDGYGKILGLATGKIERDGCRYMWLHPYQYHAVAIPLYIIWKVEDCNILWGPISSPKNRLAIDNAPSP